MGGGTCKKGDRLLFLEETDFLSRWIVHAEKVACPLFLTFLKKICFVFSQYP
jgi:hypothetical protein